MSALASLEYLWWQFDECPAERLGSNKALHKRWHLVHVFVMERRVCMTRELWKDISG